MNSLEKELIAAVRLLLRHAIGGSVPQIELMRQMQRLDKLQGHDWKESEASRSGYSKRKSRI